MVSFNLAAWIASASARLVASAASIAFRKSRSGTFASTIINRSPGRRTIKSGLLSPDWVCSLKSQWALMPAASTTWRKVSPPQRPARLIGTQDAAQLQGLAGKRLALQRQSLQLFFDL